jgi:hypothetical protein
MSEDEDKLRAAVVFLRNTGAHQIQVRYSDDKQPIIWIVVALYNDPPAGTRRVAVAASTTPSDAALRLCEQVADGGICMHCKRAVGFEPNMLARMPYDLLICWYQWDPELKTFRRGCE